jgi:pterin-4a-carbinolamine dehydratase
MAEYSAVLEDVSAQVAGTPEEARSASDAVLRVIAHLLDERDRATLAAALPNMLRAALDAPPQRIRMTGAAVVDDVATRLGCPPERARYLTQAVLSTVAKHAPNAADAIGRAVPDAADLLTPINDGLAPRGSAVPIDREPVLLTLEEIQRRLRTLVGWHGDTHRLERVVSLPEDHVTPLVQLVHRAEQELVHHAQIERERGDVTFRVWTHSLDRVTDLDLQLADRINRAVERVGSA